MPKLLAASLLLSLSASAQAGPKVVLETSKGNITLELNEEKAPITVKNFLKYVDDGFYNGVVFHRVISGFMVQGGGFAPDDEGTIKQKKSRETIQNEAKNGLKNERGTIAMARTSDPHSASAQFFINHKDNAGLDYPSRDGWGYAVFGKVVEGLDVVDAIAGVETETKRLHALDRNGNLSPQPMGDVPIENVVIKSAKRVKAESE